jgi:D-sedoheptulose 7-phosphate isomerase
VNIAFFSTVTNNWLNNNIESVKIREWYIMRDTIVEILEESKTVTTLIIKDHVNDITRLVQLIITAYKTGKKIVLFGNGGSAADAQHIAGELVGRFKLERKPLRAIALTTDISIVTSIANDYGFENVFSRQIEAQVDEGDIVIGISTSGKSPNVLKGLHVAHAKGAKIVGLTGMNGTALKEISDITIMVPSDNTPRIQEAHIIIGHILCELVERTLFEK